MSGYGPTATATATEARGALRGPAPTTAHALRSRSATLVSSAVAALMGVLPHILHHAGPLAGAALLAGAGGSLLFGAIGLIAAIPFLLRVHRRHDSWRVPAALLVLFATVFSISTFMIGPAISAGDDASSRPTTTQTAPASSATESHDAHHR